MGRCGQTGNTQEILSGIYRFCLICFVFAVLILFPSIAFADPASPDNLQIRDVKVFRHLIEDGDFFAVAAFDIAYTTPPDEPASDYFLFRFIDDTGDDIGQATPYSYGENGYQYGIASFYFEASGSPTWNAAHDIRLEGNPTAWTILPTPSIYTLAIADYCTGADQEANQSELAAWLLTTYQEIETNWGVPGELITLTTSGPVLTAYGQHYALGAMPGLNYMCPSVFTVQSVPIDWEEDDWTHQRDTDTETQWSGTKIDDMKTLLADIFGGNAIILTSIIMLAGIIALMAISYIKWQTPEPSYALVPCLILYAAKISFTPWPVFAFFCFCAAIYIGWILLGRNTV